MNALVPINTNAESYRASTDAAGLCREIVLKTAKPIQGKRYVGVEGWQAIAIAHGCAASADNVERVNDEGMSGFKATGIVRRMSDGAEIARGEGFLGDDERTWSSRPVYARRAMVQTRAISRACRSAFAHVVVMIDAGLSTTPAEEVPHEGFDNGNVIEHQPAQEPPPRAKLEGPHSSKTALRNAVHAVIAAVRAARSEEEIAAIKTEHKRTINQALRDWPDLINGDPNLEEDVGLIGTIELRRAALANTGQFDMLIESMKSCETLSSLTNWMATNEAIVDELEDTDRRAFEKERDAFEAGLSAVAHMTAG